MPYRYYPFLKGKQAEFLAFRDLGQEFLADVFPVFDVLPKTMTGESDAVRDSLDRFIKYLDRDIPAEKPFGVDLFEFDPDWRLEDDVHPLAGLVPALLQTRENFSIGLGLDRDEAYLSALQTLLNTNSNFQVFFRWQYEDIQVPEMSMDAYFELCSEFEINDAMAFHVLDLRCIYGADVIDMAGVCSEFLTKLHDLNIPVVITSSSVPQSLPSVVARNTSALSRRLEEDLWRRVSSEYEEKDFLYYGDYGVVTPEFVEPELPAQILYTLLLPKIIYSLKRQWYLARGTKFVDHADGKAQYYDMARNLVESGHFMGPTYSPGDQYIANKADRIPTPGDAKTWLRAEISHHIVNILDIR